MPTGLGKSGFFGSSKQSPSRNVNLGRRAAYRAVFALNLPLGFTSVNWAKLSQARAVALVLPRSAEISDAPCQQPISRYDSVAGRAATHRLRSVWIRAEIIPSTSPTSFGGCVFVSWSI